MTRQAERGLLELRHAVGALGQRVEGHALIGVLGGHLDDLAAAHKGDLDGVIEENRARIHGIDQVCQQAGWRKHEHLRFDGDVQRVEGGSQVSAAAFECQASRPVQELLIELVDGIDPRRGRVQLRAKLCPAARDEDERRPDHPRGHVDATHRREKGNLRADACQSSSFVACRPSDDLDRIRSSCAAFLRCLYWEVVQR